MTELDERGRLPSPADIADRVVPEDESVWERRARALTMRNGGATYTQIAERTGVSVPTARKDVRLAMREVINEPAEDMIARQRAVLHDLQRAHYVRALSGDIDSTKIVLDVLRHEAQLFGLNAPARVHVGVTDMEFAERALELMNGIGVDAVRELAAGVDAERRAELGIDPAAPVTIDGELSDNGPGDDEPWADI